jgi:hypothetical protein
MADIRGKARQGNDRARNSVAAEKIPPKKVRLVSEESGSLEIGLLQADTGAMKKVTAGWIWSVFHRATRINHLGGEEVTRSVSQRANPRALLHR